MSCHRQSLRYAGRTGMTKEVLLSLKGLQMEQGDGAEELETLTPARYYHQNGSHYIV